MVEKPSIWQRWNGYRPSKTLWFWSGTACIIATLSVGFAVGGWVTPGTAAQMAQTAADNARNKLAAAICVSQFEKSPDASVELDKLKKTSFWDRDYFIQKGGWATMPGAKEPVIGASGLCAQQLMTSVLPSEKPPGTSS